MLRAIPRYGARIPAGSGRIIAECVRQGALVQGPQIRVFEEQLSKYLGGGRAVSASFGRMAFYYILKAFDFPRGSEIVMPALTFWVIPEIARAAGLKVVFADVDPETFNLDPDALERAISARTRAVVPTHLYGLSCNMDAILRIAARHDLAVIEDCAHSLGARYRGRLVGTFGAAAFFSFQMLKPLNTYGGGMALVRDETLARRVADLAYSEPWPDSAEVLRRSRLGQLQQFFMSPAIFTVTGFPILWASSWIKARPDVYLWESIRPLDPLPAAYRWRYTNVQAALGLAGLQELELCNERTRSHARLMDGALRGLPGITTPQVPADCRHIYYQYCLYVSARDQTVRRAIRRGIDLETLHVDVCTRLPLFRESWSEAPGADRAAQAVQLPVYSSLTGQQVRQVAERVRRAVLSEAGEPLFAARRVM